MSTDPIDASFANLTASMTGGDTADRLGAAAVTLMVVSGCGR